MSFQQHGNPKYKFALTTAAQTTSQAAAVIEAATGIAPMELQVSGEPEFIAEAEGPDGTVDAVAVAQKKYTFTLSGFLTDLDKFNEEGNTFTHDGRYYIITGDQHNKATKEFQKATVSGVCYKNITGPAEEA